MNTTIPSEPATDAQFGTPMETEEYDVDAGSFAEADESTLAAFMAEQTCLGLIHHDRREYENALAAFANVDRHQFADLSEEEARDAARAMADALWRKDEVEESYVDGATVDPALAEADWSPVEDALCRRAEIVGMSEEYAERTVEAWLNHKVGGDYWTPTLIAQRLEIDAAMGGRPEKPKYGRSGHGHLAARYLVGLELHDMHTEDHWRQAVEVMTAYYDGILAGREGGR
jgi:hypothetical protein